MFTCNQCGFMAIKKAYYNQHMSGKHGSTFFKCPTCPFESKHKVSLCRHLKKCQGVVTQNAIEVSEEAKETVITTVSNDPIGLTTEDQSGVVIPVNNNINTVNNGAIEALTYNNNANSHNVYNNNYNIMIYPDQFSDEPLWIKSEDEKKKLIDFVRDKNLKSPEEIVDAISLFFQDLKRIPFRKTASNSSYTHVFKGEKDGWELRRDNDVYPSLILQTSSDISHVLNDQALTSRGRERDRLERVADNAGDFYDEVNMIEREGECYKPEGNQTNIIRRRRANREAKLQLKKKAQDAYRLYKLETSDPLDVEISQRKKPGRPKKLNNKITEDNRLLVPESVI